MSIEVSWCTQIFLILLITNIKGNLTEIVSLKLKNPSVVRFCRNKERSRPWKRFYPREPVSSHLFLNTWPSVFYYYWTAELPCYWCQVTHALHFVSTILWSGQIAYLSSVLDLCSEPTLVPSFRSHNTLLAQTKWVFGITGWKLPNVTSESCVIRSQ